jgi:hypothetical protein
MSGDFVSILERLKKGGVDFVVVGGFAGVVHGCTYVTQKIDICCEFSSDNLNALEEAIGDLHPVHRMTPNRKAFEVNEKDYEQLKNLYLDTDIGQLDCMSFIDGLGDFGQVKRASEIHEVEKIRLSILSLNALIRAKQAMGRPRDAEAVLQLEAIRKIKEQQI